MALHSLHHVIDLEWMLEAYRPTHKSGVPGIDRVVAAEYETHLEVNLLSLLDRIRSGSYKAPPVRRVYISKADGSQRPLGIATFKDKVAQRAIAMVLESIYEQDFYSCSYGFRPGRSMHQALHALRIGFMTLGLRRVLDIDIRKYFDSISHCHLRAFLDRRISDGVIRRMIDKWLKADVMEDGQLRQSTEGSPQGGVISPLLSNIFLHHLLDEWFETVVRPRLKGRCILVRYAADLVMACEDFLSAERVLAVLGKRLARYDLTLHPDKTRFIDFRFKRPNGMRHPATSGTTFDLLGLTFDQPALLLADLLALQTATGAGSFLCAQLVDMRGDRQVPEVCPVAAALAALHAPQFFVWFCVRWNIVWVNRLAIQRFGEVEQQLCQIIVGLQPVSAWAIVSLLVARQFHLQTQVLDVQIISTPFLGVVLQQQRAHHRLQCFAVIGQLD